MNEPLKGVAPQVQIPRPVVPAQQQTPQAAVPAATQPVAPEATPQAASVQEPMKERTQENFEKLLQSNQQLYQANQANTILIQQLLQSQQVAQRQNPNQPIAQQPQRAVPQQAKVDPNDFIEKDPTTGEQFINEQKLRATLAAIQERATRAEETANSFMQSAQQQEKIRQEREAFTTYPELNPRSSGYDRDFNKYTRAMITDSMLNAEEYGGRPLSFKEAADLIRAGVRPTQQAVTQAAVAQVVEQQPQQAANAAPTANQINKEQAAASVANQPPHAAADITAEELQRQQVRTRMGDDDALAERLMYTEHIFGPKSGSGQPI